MPVIPYQSHSPQIGANSFIAPDAWVIGQTTLGANVSVFFGTVIRGDIKAIRVGSGTNLQEHAMLHTSTDLYACEVGSQVTVGHRAILHGCVVEDLCIIGMGAVVLDGARIGKHSIIGAQALVPMHAKIPERSLVLGVPGKVVRTLSDKEIDEIKLSAEHYQELARNYSASLGTGY